MHNVVICNEVFVTSLFCNASALRGIHVIWKINWFDQPESISDTWLCQFSRLLLCFNEKRQEEEVQENF